MAGETTIGPKYQSQQYSTTIGTRFIAGQVNCYSYSVAWNLSYSYRTIGSTIYGKATLSVTPQKNYMLWRIQVNSDEQNFYDNQLDHYKEHEYTDDVPVMQRVLFDYGTVVKKTASASVTYENTSSYPSFYIYAKRIPITVKFDSNGGSGAMADQFVSAGLEAELNPCSFRRTGYRFLGWSENASSTAATYQDEATVLFETTISNYKDKKLYAVWEKSLTVTYDAGGGEASGTPVDSYANANGVVALASSYGLSKANCRFLGWVLDKRAVSDGIEYPAGHLFSGDTQVTITSDVTATAQWKGNESIVTLNQGGGTGGTSRITAEYAAPMPTTTNGEPVTMPTRTGYAFDGYYSSANGGGTKYYNADGTSAGNWDRTGNPMLYANWIANTYVVQYYPNYSGATAEPRSQKCRYGSTYAFKGASLFPRDGYRFVRWNTSFDDTGTRYDAGMSFANLTDEDGATITLYAIWARTLSVTVTAAGADNVGLLGNSPTVTATPSEAIVGEVVQLNAQTSDLNGISFQRWAIFGQIMDDHYATQNETSFVVESEQDVTVTAVYERREAEVQAVLSAPCSAVAALSTGATVRCTSTELGETAATTCRWGDTVWFKAEAVTGYAFAGWWDRNTGERMSMDRTYGHVLSKSQTRMEARYSVQVSVTAQPSTEEVGGETVTYTGTVSAWVDGVQQDTSASFPVTIGSSLRIAAQQAEGSYFYGWNANGSAISLAQDQPGILPTEGVAYVATFGATPPTFFYGVRDVRNTTADGTTNENTSSTAPIGETKIVGTEVVALSASEAQSQLGEAGLAYYNGFRYYKIVGLGVTARLVVSPATGNGALQLLSVPQKIEIPAQSSGPDLQGGGLEPAESDFVYNETFSTSEENGNILITSTWGTPVKCTVTVRSDTYGTAVAYSGGSAQGASTISELLVNTNVTVVATPNTGYMFDGWFDGSTLVSKASSYTFGVKRNITLEARFREDTSAIFAWGAGEDVKDAEWTGAVATMPRPMDPVAARVDAAGYPVQLTVGTFSSPSAEPTAERTVVFGSQGGRRLPRMRPERFLRVSVAARSEVDAIVVGTNMAEVN